jgi:hypothetical protein
MARRTARRRLEGRDDPDATASGAYCAAVRSALTDDDRPPLEAPGLKLEGRLSAIFERLDRVARRRGSRGS